MKKVLLNVLIAIVLFLPISVLASTTTNLSCPTSVAAGGNFVCNVSINTTESMQGFQANMSIGNGLTFGNVTNGSGFNGTSTSSKLLLYRDSVATGNIALGKINLSAKTTPGNQTITLSNALISVGGSDVSISGATDTIKILSNVNTLSALSISEGTLSPSFNTNTKTYSATVPGNVSSITISANKTDSLSTLSGTGTKNLAYGLNKFAITVTSESNVKNTYNINITRTDNRSTVNTLKTLTISTGSLSPKFSSSVASYKVTVGSDISKIDIDATLTDSNSSFVSG